MNHFFVYTLVFSPFIALSQTIEVKPVFISDTISLLEPWFFYISIKNMSDSNINVCPITNRGPIFQNGSVIMEIQKDSIDTWTTVSVFRNLHYERHAIDGLPKPGYQLLAGEEQRSNEITIPPPFALINLEPAGYYSIRILYDPLYCNSKTYKKVTYAPKKLFFSKMTHEDALLYKHLQSLKKGDYVYSSLLYSAADTAMINDAEMVLHNFPNATVIPYFHLYLCYGYYNMARYNIKDIPKCLDYLRNARNHGLEAIKSKKPVIIYRAELLLDDFARFVSDEVFSPLDEEAANAAYPEFLYKREKR